MRTKLRGHAPPFTTSPPRLRAIAIAAFLAAMGNAASAQIVSVSSITATGNYALNGAANTNLTSSNMTGVDVLAFPYDNPSNAVLHSYGYDYGTFGSRSSGQGVYAVNGSFKIVETITNNTGSAASANFHFQITPGMLQNSIGSPLGGAQFVEAGLAFDIRRDGNSLWGSTADLKTTASGTTFAMTGDNIYNGADTMYSVLGASRDIDLGVINAGQTITLSYELTTYANGDSAAGEMRHVDETQFVVPEGWNAFGHCGYGQFGDGYGKCQFHAGDIITIPGYDIYPSPSGSHASSGDPFSFNFGNGDYHASLNGSNSLGEVVLNPVPEPSGAAMLGGGIGLLALLARRRRRAQR